MAELRAAGFELSDDAGRIDAVIASFDRTFVYRKLQIAFDAIRAGARFFATNADRLLPGTRGRRARRGGDHRGDRGLHGGQGGGGRRQAFPIHDPGDSGVARPACREVHHHGRPAGNRCPDGSSLQAWMPL